MPGTALDMLDVALLEALRDSPRAGLQELARTVGVARSETTVKRHSPALGAPQLTRRFTTAGGSSSR